MDNKFKVGDMVTLSSCDASYDVYRGMEGIVKSITNISKNPEREEIRIRVEITKEMGTDRIVKKGYIWQNDYPSSWNLLKKRTHVPGWL